VKAAGWQPGWLATNLHQFRKADDYHISSGEGSMDLFTGLFTTENLIAFITLLVLEVVLGIDNVIFIAILSARLPEGQRDLGRQLGIAIAVVSRIVLLLGISWVLGLTNPLLNIMGNALTGRDLILIAGGAFLIGKSTLEIHHKLESADTAHGPVAATATLLSVIAQILIIDVVFSLDSVITAVGLSNSLIVMISAIMLAAALMVFASGAISRFVEQHPTMKMLALSFLILIGSLLVIEGWSPERAEDLHLHNYAYFAMAFSFLVEIINMRLRRTPLDPVKLHNQPALTNKGTVAGD
jgi:predicted tellurium resistance membrane protein TerC